MKLTDAIKEKGTPYWIPDCSRDELPEFFKELGFKVGVEIGVLVGKFTEKFCLAGLKMYGIDPWVSFSGQGRGQQLQTQENYNYSLAKKRLSPYKDCTLIKKASMEALVDFDPESLDFVYIDGDHRFRYIAEDIYEWYWKVKHGGIVAGDDYYLTQPRANNLICQVSPVVDAFVKTYGIENFYIFDGNWMFFKP